MHQVRFQWLLDSLTVTVRIALNLFDVPVINFKLLVHSRVYCCRLCESDSNGKDTQQLGQCDIELHMTHFFKQFSKCFLLVIQ